MCLRKILIPGPSHHRGLFLTSNGPGISPVAEVNSHITGTSYNTQIAIWIFNASDPRSNAAEVPGRALLTLDQGSGQVVCVSLALILRLSGFHSVYNISIPDLESAH